MSQPPPPPPPSSQPGELQFETAEPAASPGGPAPQALSCVGCGQPIVDVYYAAGDKIVCPNCRNQYVTTLSSGSGFGRFVKATVFGIVAGAVGAAIWYGVGRATGYNIGLVAIVVGLMVGVAVRAGSGGRGGRGYQVLAVLLTYGSICATYVPPILEEVRNEFRAEKQDTSSTQPAAATAADEGPGPIGYVIAYGIVFGIALAVPFIGGVGGITLLIIGFALWEAWKINTRQVADLAGPYALAGAPPPTGVA